MLLFVLESEEFMEDDQKLQELYDLLDLTRPEGFIDCTKCAGSGLSRHTEIRDGFHFHLPCASCRGAGEISLDLMNR